MKESDLNQILQKKGYGLASSFKPAFKSDFEKRSFKDAINDQGEMSNAKPSDGRQPVGEAGYAFRYTGMCTVRVKVFRRRLCDPDNNMPKWHVDAIRRSKLLHDDSAKEMLYFFDGQEKVETNDEERIEVTLEYNDAWWQ